MPMLDREVILEKTYFGPSCCLQTGFQTNSNNNILWKEWEMWNNILSPVSCLPLRAVPPKQLYLQSTILVANLPGLSCREYTGRFALRKVLLLVIVFLQIIVTFALFLAWKIWGKSPSSVFFHRYMWNSHSKNGRSC